MTAIEKNHMLEEIDKEIRAFRMNNATHLGCGRVKRKFVTDEIYQEAYEKLKQVRDTIMAIEVDA